jgi:hypothetical protein
LSQEWNIHGFRDDFEACLGQLMSVEKVVYISLMYGKTRVKERYLESFTYPKEVFEARVSLIGNP